MYSIRKAQKKDHYILLALNTLCFLDTAPQIDPEVGEWWIVWHDKEPVGFAGVQEGTTNPDYGYLSRAGVLSNHRGNGLHGKLFNKREAYAIRKEWKGLLSDTTNNPVSTNNMIKFGFTAYEPEYPWSFSDANSIYWKKVF